MLRFALFGAGRAGSIHARNIANNPNGELGFVYDVDKAAANGVVASFGGSLATNQEEVWSSDQVDAVVIASSTNTHVELLRRSIEAGLPTYCEKPIDEDIERVKRVVEVADASGLPVFVGFRRRFMPDLQIMHSKIRNGDLGRIETFNIVARDHQPPSLEYVKVSGGFLLDKMIHYFDLVPWLAGEQPSEVFAVGSSLVDPAIGDLGDIDTAVVTLRFPGGSLCVIENGRRSIYGGEERIEVFGAKGMLQSTPPHHDQVLRFNKTGVARSRYADNDNESFAFAMDAFIHSVEAGEPVSPSLRDGLRAQLIADAANESLRTNKAVRINYDLGGKRGQTQNINI